MLVTENLVKQYGELKAQLGARDALQLSGEFPEPGVKQALESLMIIWLGMIAQTEGQAAGLGVLTANAMAALGGCWWPIEITPGWMQAIQNFLPTGWTMDALHKLISFQAGAASAIPQAVILVAATLVAGYLAVRRFEYQ